MSKENRSICQYIYNLSMTVSAILILLLLASCGEPDEKLHLTVTDPRCGTVYQQLEVESETIFVLRYRHSVSGSLVEGRFLISENSMIEPLSTEYTSFGPGLPLDRWESYKIEDGLVTVYHEEEARETIRLWVSSYTEETLIVNELEIPLYRPEISHLLLEIRAVP